MNKLFLLFVLVPVIAFSQIKPSKQVKIEIFNPYNAFEILYTVKAEHELYEKCFIMADKYKVEVFFIRRIYQDKTALMDLVFRPREPKTKDLKIDKQRI